MATARLHLPHLHLPHPGLPHLPAAWLPALRMAERIGAAALVTVLAPALFALCILAGLLLAMGLARLM